MTERRIRLLFVINQFRQGGSERFLFELCKALDKDRFAISILTRTGAVETEHYYSKLLDLGIPIYRRLPNQRVVRRLRPYLRRLPGGIRLLDAPAMARARRAILPLLAQHDLTNIIQIENYYALQPILPDNEQVLIYLMSHRFQYAHDLYGDCRPGRTYRFVIVDPAQREELQDSPCGDAETHYFPLAMDFRGRPELVVPEPPGGVAQIGLFSRLSPERPIEPFFHCLQHLLRDVVAVLHVYGRGDWQTLEPLLERLGIRDKVIFEGHQPDIEAALRRDRIGLVWMISRDAFLGYGSIEVASFGIPVVFWNVHTAPAAQVLAETGEGLHAYGTVAEFVAFNAEILADRERLVALGRRMRAYMVATYDIGRHIAGLEVYYADLVRRIGGRPDGKASSA